MTDPLEDMIRRAAPDGPSPLLLERIERTARTDRRRWRRTLGGAGAAAAAAVAAIAAMQWSLDNTNRTPAADMPSPAVVVRVPADSDFLAPLTPTEPFIVNAVYHVKHKDARP